MPPAGAAARETMPTMTTEAARGFGPDPLQFRPMNSTSFLWHDFETFGADPRRDRPAQFAALRTSDDLEPIDEPCVIYCQPADDLLPHPMACLITGITPQLARERGIPENSFAAAINEQMSRPGTCAVGYNNFRFDDEVTRHLFWRNFFDPYAREYANGNSRFDLIDLLRMTAALRPDGIKWPRRDDGTPSFRLEDIAAANGMDTSRAHDALADVEATLAMARLVRQHQPKLWDWALTLRQKHVIAGLLQKGEPLLHSSARIPASHWCTAAILPIAVHPSYAGQWIVWNLGTSPEKFADLDPELLADLMWTPGAELPEGLERLPVKLVRSNRCPMLSPMSTLDDAARERTGINPAAIAAHAAWLKSNPDFVSRIQRLFEPGSDTHGSRPDPELALYDGFVPRGDQQVYPRIRQLDGSALADIGQPFSDERLNELLFRYRARLFPDSLSTEENARWQLERQRRLVDDPELTSIQWPAYSALVTELMQKHPDRRALLGDLAEWPSLIGLQQAPTINQ